MEIQRRGAGPAKMVRDPGRLDSLGQCMQVPQIRLVKGLAAADGEGYPVHHHRVVAANLVEIVQRFPAGDEVVLRDDLKPVHWLRCSDEIPIVFGP